jgi:hypothetical protein
MPITTTVIPIKSFTLSVASNKTFNEWKGNIYLYKQNGTMAVDLRFVDNPDQFMQYESVNPQGCSLIYTSFTQFHIYADILHSSDTISVQLTQGASAGFAKMILIAWPHAAAQMMNMPMEHQADTRTFQLSKKKSVTGLKKK